MLKYSVKEGIRGGSGGDRAAGRGGMGGGGGGNIDVKSAAVVMIFCSLFLGTSGPLRATVSSTVFTGSYKRKQMIIRYMSDLISGYGGCNNQINVFCVNNEIICVPSEIHLAQIKSVFKANPSGFERLLASIS